MKTSENDGCPLNLARNSTKGDGSEYPVLRGKGFCDFRLLSTEREIVESKSQNELILAQNHVKVIITHKKPT